MTTTELAWVALSLVVGLAVGVAYFRALWWTIERLPRARRPALLLLGSSLARIAPAVAAFWLISGGQWQRLVACVLGFVVARVIMVHVYRPRTATADAADEEVVADGADA